MTLYATKQDLRAKLVRHARAALTRTSMILFSRADVEAYLGGLRPGSGWAASTRRPATGPLRRHPETPRYSADAEGRPVYLTGSHTSLNLVHRGSGDPPPRFDYEPGLCAPTGSSAKSALRRADKLGLTAMRLIRAGLLSGLMALVAVAAESSPASTLEDSGPIVATRDGEVIEGLRIKAAGRPAIEVNGFSNVAVRNVQIIHQGAHGISCDHAPGLIVENVDIQHSGAQTASIDEGHIGENNIDCRYSDGLRVRNARLRGGSSGVWVLQSSDVHLSYLEGYDFRGPFPRGQLAQFVESPNCILEDFSAINDPNVAWTEDNVSLYYSDDCVVRRGLLDGNNSPSGVGVMFEGSRNGLVEDVDTVAQGNGSFSAYPGHDITFRRTRARDNVCNSQAGRGPPLSDALVWAGSPDSSGLRLEASKYFNLCNPGNLVWEQSSFDMIQITEENFSPRPAIKLRFPWDEGSMVQQ